MKEKFLRNPKALRVAAVLMISALPLLTSSTCPSCTSTICIFVHAPASPSNCLPNGGTYCSAPISYSYIDPNTHKPVKKTISASVGSETCITGFPLKTPITFSFGEVPCYTDSSGHTHYYLRPDGIEDVQPTVWSTSLLSPPLCGQALDYDLYYSCNNI